MPTAPDDTAIREQAYYFWEQDGRPEGRETEYWMRAMVAVTEKRQLDTLVDSGPKMAKSKASPSKAKPVASKSEPAKKPKKK
jgi:hypothetical protein